MPAHRRIGLSGVAGEFGLIRCGGCSKSSNPNATKPQPIPMKPARKKVSSTAKAVAGWRLWLFRLLVTVGVPAVFFVILELGLRLAGFGYPTHFLLPSSLDGQKTFVENNQFGWRFFGRQMAREPYPFSISQAKPAGTVRIFVFGESAAYG